ncbi:MAG: UDP-N-acetylmuramate dehydrogenase [Mycolicibacterium sp.]|nr:UDP-N-acetylmuramate dehydrogenase [Mycolicibacterium sp.]
MAERQERFAGALVADDVPLAPLTTLRIGPVARRVITCSTTDQVIAVLRALDSDPPGPVLVLAGGSNVLLAEQLTDLTVVRLANTQIRIDGATLRAQAGAVWDDVVAAAVRYGLGGLECLSGIPGSAGATPVQNVGAYGVEVADMLRRVRLLDRRDRRVRWADPDELRFGYRSSVLKNSTDTVVLEVEFELCADGRSAPLRYRELVTALGAADGERTHPARVREAVLALRRRKGMVLDDGDHDTWSVGSFFTNPVVGAEEFAALRARVTGAVPHWPGTDGVKLAAGWLVEQAGFAKGFPGAGAPARLSTKHALAVTNRGTAIAADVASVARTVRDGVYAAFGITLVPEPVLVGVMI